MKKVKKKKKDIIIIIVSLEEQYQSVPHCRRFLSPFFFSAKNEKKKE